MANTNSTSSSTGVSFGGLLTIIFITLKLLGKIAWSWWWVLSPLWIPAAFVAVVWLVVALVWLIAVLCKR